MSAQALDRLGHRGVDLLGQVDQEGQAARLAGDIVGISEPPQQVAADEDDQGQG
jgi:hypothetical protein